jgi:CheY-like chemotaxis protein
MRRAGLMTHIAHSGPDGLIIARHYRPDAILVDLELPGMDGRAVARALKADPATAELPVVLFCSRAELLEAWLDWRDDGVAEAPQHYHTEQALVGALFQLEALQRA